MKIFVKVKAKAREEKVEKIDDIHFVVQTKDIAEKGKANEGVIRLLSRYFKIPKSHICILSGKTARLKVIDVSI
jgi:uncharacterized protein YggU (UPF0235/DUF167 family)